MITMGIIGALLGATLFWVVLKVAPPRPRPITELARFDQQQSAGRPAALAVTTTGTGSVQDQLGALVTRQLAVRNLEYTSLRQDLALTGKTFEAVMGAKVVAAVGGFLIALMLMVGLQLTVGLPLPAGTPLVLALLVAAVFFFLPDLDARSVATRRRRDFRRALGSYLDLVALEMAGSAAPAEALPNAARVGTGWPLALLRDTLFRATRSGRNAWDALTELGERVGVAELRDLGSLIRLVSHDGARVRQTLTARAATMRRRELAEAEGLAGKRDQSMRLAQILIGFGFIVFIGYPAIINVLQF
ncbi:MAG: type II secretion system protein [Actinomycetota bacterium]|nr:type II secretion system protein [Actinomycetota bacterium]MDQ2957643.1 type II secretion system protein [Actinomycetota bacterium]